MKFNKKYVLSSIILIGAIGVSILSTYKIKADADSLTITQIKQELDEKDKQLEDKDKQLDDKINESGNKDKEIEELNNKIAAQESTINQLNNSINSLSEGLNNTNIALDNAKAVEKEDKQEVTNHADTGDANLQKQVDEVKNIQTESQKKEETRKKEKPTQNKSAKPLGE